MSEIRRLGFFSQVWEFYENDYMDALKNLYILEDKHKKERLCNG